MKQKLLKTWLMLVLLLVGVGTGWADDVILYKESFTSTTSKAAQATADKVKATQSMFYDKTATVWSHYLTCSSISKNQTSTHTAAYCKDENTTSIQHTAAAASTEYTILEVTGIDISGATNLKLNYAFGFNGGTNYKAYAKIDNGDYVQIKTATSGGQWQYVTNESISGTGNQLSLKFTYKSNKAQNIFFLDEILVTGTKTAASTKTLSDISLSGQKTEFYVGDTFSFKGTVTASYEEADVEDADVTNSTTFSGYDMNTVGAQTVTASYTEGTVTKTAQYIINVKEKQSYTVSYFQPDNGTLAVVDGNGNEIVSGTKIYYGEHVIATATPSVGYKFRNLQFTDATTHTFTASNRKDWVMGDHGISIEANFDLIPTYTVAWSVNGKIVKSETVEENTAVSAPDVESINGKDFYGWVENPTIASDETPTRVTPSATAVKTVTYYAAFANIEGQEDQWVKIVPSSTGSLEAGVYALISPDGHAFNGSITTGNNQHGEQTTGTFNFVDGVATSAPEGVCELTLAVVTNGYTLYNSTYGYLYASAAASGNLNWHDTENSYWSVGVYSNAQGSQDQWRYKLSNSTPQLRYYNSNFRTYGTGTNNGEMVNLAKKIPGNAVYSDFTTLPYVYTRTVTSGNYGTICLPAAVNNIEGATIYNIAGTTKNGDEITGIVLTENEGDMEAGKPYIFKATASQLVASYTGAPMSEAVSAIGLVGNLGSTSVTVTDGNYVLSQNQIRMVNGGTATIGQNRAYINLTSVEEYNPSAGVKALYFGLDGSISEETAIKMIEQNVENVTIYNLNGQRVSKAQKGIYIVNGKKVMFK